MELNEATEILQQAGFLVEARRPGMRRQAFKSTGDFDLFMNDSKIKALYSYAVKKKKKNDRELMADGNDPDEYDSIWYDMDESYYDRLGAAVNGFFGEGKVDIYMRSESTVIVETDNNAFEFDTNSGEWDNIDLGEGRQDPAEFFKTIFIIATEK